MSLKLDTTASVQDLLEFYSHIILNLQIISPNISWIIMLWSQHLPCPEYRWWIITWNFGQMTEYSLLKGGWTKKSSRSSPWHWCHGKRSDCGWKKVPFNPRGQKIKNTILNKCEKIYWLLCVHYSRAWRFINFLNFLSCLFFVVRKMNTNLNSFGQCAKSQSSGI